LRKGFLSVGPKRILSVLAAILVASGVIVLYVRQSSGNGPKRPEIALPEKSVVKSDDFSRARAFIDEGKLDDCQGMDGAGGGRP
jgi:hypothetical protein